MSFNPRDPKKWRPPIFDSSLASQMGPPGIKQEPPAAKMATTSSSENSPQPADSKQRSGSLQPASPQAADPLQRSGSVQPEGSMLRAGLFGYQPAASEQPHLPAPEKQPNYAEPQESVNVVVGKAKTVFSVYLSFVVHHSSWFQEALDKLPDDASPKSITLEQVTPEVFGAFIVWVHTQKIPVTHGKRQLFSIIRQPENDKPPYSTLIGLWAFADFLKMKPTLQNLVIDEIMAKQRRLDTVPVEMLGLVHDVTTSGSPLRRLFIDFIVWDAGSADDKYVVENPDLFPKQILLETVVAQIRRRNSSNIRPNLNAVASWGSPGPLFSRQGNSSGGLGLSPKPAGGPFNFSGLRGDGPSAVPCSPNQFVNSPLFDSKNYHL